MRFDEVYRGKDGVANSLSRDIISQIPKFEDPIS
jgi:hypothetical protein